MDYCEYIEYRKYEAVGITGVKTVDKVMGKIDPKVIEKAVKDKEKAVKNGKIITK
jgi:hypothetical protein